MRELTLTSLLLACITGEEKAQQIEGDFMEEYPQAGKNRYLMHVISLLPSFFWLRFSSAPLRSAGLGVLTVFLAYLLTTLLLTPLILKSVDIREWAFITAIFMFRGFACFVIGVCLHDYGKRLALSGLVCAIVLLIALLGFRVFLLLQGLVQPGAVTFDIAQNLFFYGLFSILPLITGFLYGRYVKYCSAYYSQSASLSDTVVRQS